MSVVYGYSRVSTNKQTHARQINAIQEKFPSCGRIYKDNCTGRTQNRDGWKKLKERVKPGDTIVFEDVCRMSRNAADGFAEYKELYAMGVELVFINSPHINTAKYRELLKENMENPISKAFDEVLKVKTGDQATDKLLAGMFGSVKEFVETINMQNVEKDILQAFQRAEDEIAKLSERTKAGIRAHGGAEKISKAKTGMQYRNANILKRMIDVLKFSRCFHIGEQNIHTDKETAKLANTSMRSVVRIRERILEEKGTMTDEEYLKHLQEELKKAQSRKRK